MSKVNSKIVYLANVRLPTEKAHGIQIAKMCEALADQGVELELIVPSRFNIIEEEIFKYYKIKENFVLKKLSCLDLISSAVWLGPIAYWIEALSFAWSVKKYLKHFTGLIYTRELSNLTFLRSNIKMVYEAHNLPKKSNWFFRNWLSKVTKLITITKGLKDDFVDLNFSEEKILVQPDAVDLKMFKIDSSKTNCRDQLNLPPDRKIILYAGHFYDWKGVGVLLSTAKFLPEYLIILVGGTGADVVRFKKLALKERVSNVLIVGHRPIGEVPIYLGAADVLVLPNSAKQMISSHYTSPLKLFEYLASQRPIVVSNLPSLREILDEQTATFFEPDDPQSLAQSIKFVFENPTVVTQKVELAYLRVQNFTWEKRAERILKFIL